MKRWVNLFLAVIYFFGVSGIPIHTHFCGSTLTAIQVFDWQDDNCACEDLGSNDCCSDLVIKPQVKEGAIDVKIREVPKRPFIKFFTSFETNKNCSLKTYGRNGFIGLFEGKPIHSPTSDLFALRVLRI